MQGIKKKHLWDHFEADLHWVRLCYGIRNINCDRRSTYFLSLMKHESYPLSRQFYKIGYDEDGSLCLAK